MPSSGEVLLWDLSRKGGNSCWSANVWKTRLVLNYKNIPYRTTWLSHPELQPTLQGAGVSPNAEGTPYTVPCIQLPNGETVMESLAIATKLESLHPSPSLHLDANMHEKAKAVSFQVVRPLFPIFMPIIGRTCIVDDAREYFYASKEAAFGMSLDEVEKKGGEQSWVAAQGGLQALKALLTENKVDEGPFILGSRVNYGDFVVVAMLEGLRRIERALFDRVVGFDGSIGEVYRACEVWMKHDT
ncbi:hypothetical protein LTR62_000505 [Meristemomyces frigidus]|uniref:GST N-terminal domain-containing protein n=1 Tax=Meristemomyces frigidus TaxID=1508187 RepID=A0AAN7YCE4_9PEZI|nr:hypothetical protein LTR62_000505 [Meristemomyces frigidus]